MLGLVPGAVGRRSSVCGVLSKTASAPGENPARPGGTPLTPHLRFSGQLVRDEVLLRREAALLLRERLHALGRNL